MTLSGFRAGIALLASDLVLEPEFHRVLPTDISTYVARVPYPERVTEASLDEATENLAGAVDTLRPIRPDLVVWACTSGSFFRGHAYNKELEARISRASGGARAVTASSAVVAGLRALGARRIGVLTPYSEDINLRLRAFLTEAGFQVLSMHQLYDDTDMDDFELQSIAGSDLVDAARDADRTQAEALLVSCTGVPMVGVIEELEADRGKPVVGSNLALMHEILIAAGHQGEIHGAGTLLRSVASTSVRA